MSIVEAMDELAELIRSGVDRPVTTDPRNLTALPAVLVEPPALDASVSTACAVLARFDVLVIGLPGARTELGPLSDLLGEVLAVLPGWTLAEPVGYVPLTAAGSAEPCQAYRITVELM